MTEIMAKCIFCKKSHKTCINNQYRCEITGKHLAFKCDNWSSKKKNCKHCKQSLFGNIYDWFVNKFL